MRIIAGQMHSEFQGATAEGVNKWPFEKNQVSNIYENKVGEVRGRTVAKLSEMV
ncbi:MAG: hypothetical protein HQM09_13830 [Candidatus Riflebacteria bacterium]|nr:hypothetical protein [Candidatus Riflebacteria bacterium]